MKKSLLSVALCVMTLLIGISPVSAQGQNKEYQETLHKMLLLYGGGHTPGKQQHFIQRFLILLILPVCRNRGKADDQCHHAQCD